MDKTPRRSRKVTNNDEAEALKIIIEEQRRDCEYLLHIYNRARAIEGLLLTATFGILAYLYSTPGTTPGTKADISNRLFVPAEDYGKVIYFMAAGFFAVGLAKLVLLVFGKHPWVTPYDIPKDNYEYTQVATLKHYKEKYDECLKFNGEKYFKRKETLNFLFYSILISAIILIVIKTLN